MTRNGAVTRNGAGTRDGIVLREVGPLDARVIAELHRRCFSDGLGGAVWSAASIAKALSLFGSYAYLAAVAPETGSRADVAEFTLAGILLARTQSGESEILTLGVVADWRRQGTARALLQAALTRARQAGAGPAGGRRGQPGGAQALCGGGIRFRQTLAPLLPPAGRCGRGGLGILPRPALM